MKSLFYYNPNGKFTPESKLPNESEICAKCGCQRTSYEKSKILKPLCLQCALAKTQKARAKSCQP